MYKVLNIVYYAFLLSANLFGFTEQYNGQTVFNNRKTIADTINRLTPDKVKIFGVSDDELTQMNRRVSIESLNTNKHFYIDGNFTNLYPCKNQQGIITCWKTYYKFDKDMFYISAHTTNRWKEFKLRIIKAQTHNSFPYRINMNDLCDPVPFQYKHIKDSLEEKIYEFEFKNKQDDIYNSLYLLKFLEVSPFKEHAIKSVSFSYQDTPDKMDFILTITKPKLSDHKFYVNSPCFNAKIEVDSNYI
ncbi:hypothetical protein [Heterosigma akashiwo virus 01]|uniref:Uncharacterized protein n=1 Tax=Heterosigma akashiwo virus 01 TaxID=97195 RepID=A0A1C9C5J2_HAV01|nr:hypothetical protein D1R72_gp231 [Heterosigma akashiwo virus 01]AOM63562.1 hypothetical protein [Heterosigma akashiwo virus 01]